MSIKTTYNFHNVSIPNAIIKIDRLWGSSKEGWTGYISVNTAELIPAVGVEGEEGYMPARTVMHKLTDFNRHTANMAGQSPEQLMYNALIAEFGGVPVAEDEVLGTVSVPSAVTMRQARLALLAAGHLATVDAALAQDPAAKIQWEYATHVYRTEALVGQMAQLLSLSDQQLDELFIAASKL
jgi:hypothetical protein